MESVALLYNGKRYLYYAYGKSDLLLWEMICFYYGKRGSFNIGNRTPLLWDMGLLYNGEKGFFYCGKREKKIMGKIIPLLWKQNYSFNLGKVIPLV